MNDEQFQDQSVISSRTESLKQYAEALLRQASEFQTLITTAKTSAKRDFYKKKMNKVRKDVHSVLATLKLLEMTENKHDAAISTTDNFPS